MLVYLAMSIQESFTPIVIDPAERERLTLVGLSHLQEDQMAIVPDVNLSETSKRYSREFHRWIGKTSVTVSELAEAELTAATAVSPIDQNPLND